MGKFRKNATEKIDQMEAQQKRLLAPVSGDMELNTPESLSQQKKTYQILFSQKSYPWNVCKNTK